MILSLVLSRSSSGPSNLSHTPLPPRIASVAEAKHYKPRRKKSGHRLMRHLLPEE
jgi:hypothetical protein